MLSFFWGVFVALVVLLILNAVWPSILLKVLSALSVREREFVKFGVGEYEALRKKFTKAS